MSAREAITALASFLFVAGSLLCAGALAKEKVHRPAQQRGIAASAHESRSATLPFDEVLDLYRLKDGAGHVGEQQPPVDAIAQRLEIDGRVLDVLADKRWVDVPLLERATETVLEDLPVIKGAVLAVMDGRLRFIANRKSRFNFAVGISTMAAVDGNLRTASIVTAGAALVRCRLGFDSSILKLASEIFDRHGDVVIVLVRDNRCALRWQQRNDYVEPGTMLIDAPLADPVIPTAHASIVSTLEGDHLLRVAYALRFVGRQSIEFELPRGHVLVRAYLNGRPIAANDEPGNIKLDVFAAHAGETGADLEFVLAANDRDYLLSGQLSLALPRPSWLVLKRAPAGRVLLHVDERHLVAGQNIARAKYVYDIWSPGKVLHFHQFVVHRSTPPLTLEYAVSLEGEYFRTGG
jgi:hypothetical protein